MFTIRLDVIISSVPTNGVRTINLPAADRNEEPLTIGRPPITTDDVKTPQQFFEVSLIFLIHFF